MPRSCLKQFQKFKWYHGYTVCVCVMVAFLCSLRALVPFFSQSHSSLICWLSHFRSLSSYATIKQNWHRWNALLCRWRREIPVVALDTTTKYTDMCAAPTIVTMTTTSTKVIKGTELTQFEITQTNKQNSVHSDFKIRLNCTCWFCGIRILHCIVLNNKKIE